MNCVNDMKKDYNWQHVFAVANDGKVPCDRTEDGYWVENNLIGRPEKSQGATCTDDVFTMDDVATIIDASDGENDGASWMVVGVLNDTRAFFIEAGCDYTGWDCHSSGSCWVADSLADLLRWGMTDEARERLPSVQSAVDGGTW